MPNVYQFSETEILAFALVLLRLSAFFVSWPVFGVASVPGPVKVLLAFLVAVVIFPVVGWRDVGGDLLTNSLIFMAVREVFIGALIGFLCRLFFFVISVSGELVSVSMGLSNAQILNPALGTMGSPVEQFQVALATLFFLSINGHHLFLSGIVDSFSLIPLGAMSFDFTAFKGSGQLVQEVVVAGIKMSAPVMVAVLFMNVAMGVVGRAVPQINVLITSLPVNILVGFAVMSLCAPLFIFEMKQLLGFMGERLFGLMKTF